MCQKGHYLHPDQTGRMGSVLGKCTVLHTKSGAAGAQGTGPALRIPRLSRAVWPGCSAGTQLATASLHGLRCAMLVDPDEQG